jgi:hypothetical protein
MSRASRPAPPRKKAPKKPVFSETGEHAMKVLAIVCELAEDAGFVSLDALMDKTPEAATRLRHTAEVALRGLKKLEKRGSKGKKKGA